MSTRVTKKRNPSRQPDSTEASGHFVSESAAVYDWSPAPGALPLNSPFVRQLMSHLGATLADLADRYQANGRSLEDLGPADQLAERMVAALPAPSPWNQALGPFYSSAQITKVLGGVSRQAVADRRARRTLLALRTRDDQWVYPTFQFDSNQEVLNGLPEVLRILAESGVDDWTLAGWLSSPLRSLGGMSPRAWLADGRPLEPLLVAARDAAQRFAQ